MSMWSALCPGCVEFELGRGMILRPVEECTVGHTGERSCEKCGKPFVGGCTDTLSSGDYRGHAKQGRDNGNPCARKWYGFPGSARGFTTGPHANEPCGCGKPATKMDPHNDGDCPLEFCADCYEKEERRLTALEQANA